MPLLPPSRTFATVTNALVGGLNFTFNKYRLETTATPTLQNGIDPALNAPPTAGDRHVEYSVGDYNVENLYDYRRPERRLRLRRQPRLSGRHAAVRLRAGERRRLPGTARPDRAADRRRPARARHPPRAGGGGSGHLRGRRRRALVRHGRQRGREARHAPGARAPIKAQSGIAYDAAFDRDGSDDRGIIAALLYRTDRAGALPATGRPSGARPEPRGRIRDRPATRTTRTSRT